MDDPVWDGLIQKVWQDTIKKLEEKQRMKQEPLTDIPWNTYTYLNLKLRRN